MKNKIATFTLLFLTTFCFSQTFDWGFNVGGHIDDGSFDITKVSNGIVSSSSGGIIKYSEEGNIIWKFDFFKDNISYNAGITSLASDEDDNIYAILSFNRNETIKGIDFFDGRSLIKIDAEGDVLWCRSLGYSRNNTVIYKNNTIYVLGDFYGQTTINNEIEIESKKFWDCISYINRTGNDIYMAKFNTIGVLLETSTYGDDYDDFFIAAAIDNDENIYFTSSYGLRTCSVSHSQVTKLDTNLNVIWSKRVSTEENESQIIYPTNLFFSTNNKLYLWGYNYGTVITDEFKIEAEFNGDIGANLLEFDSNNGHFLRLNHYPFHTTHGIYTTGGHWSLITSANGYISDFKGDLFIFTSTTSKFQFENSEFIPQDSYENILLFKVNKKDFSSSYITHFTGEISEYHHFSKDKAAPFLIDKNKLYLTASFQSKPLYIFDNEIANNSGNNNTDILLAKLDISDLVDKNDLNDDDNDTVLNYLDLCPNTPNGQEVDSHGCSISQKDIDNDGILNDYDKCPNTLPGVLVDSNGCELFILPLNNFKITATDELCPNSNNGQILIKGANQTYNYFITINGESYDINFSDELLLENLAPGNYKICIFVKDAPKFERCFNLVIDKATEIEISSKVDYSKNQVELNLSGSDNYFVQHNNKLLTTNKDKILLTLASGDNSIIIYTDKECRGTYKENINNNETYLYPNPFNSYLNVAINQNKSTETKLELYTISGALILTKEAVQNENFIRINTENISTGIYIVKITSKNNSKNFKVVKK